MCSAEDMGNREEGIIAMRDAIVTAADEKSKIVLVAGFLGAGKTTLLKEILSSASDMSDTVVIVNEFGDVGIDGSMLQGEKSDVIELTNGCICCTLLVDLTVMLKKIAEDFHPRYIVIEASGVADPRSIIGAVKQDQVKAHVELYKNVTVMDADCWMVRELLGELFSLQLQTADLILLNKMDLLDKGDVGKCLDWLHERVPHAQVVPTLHCRIDPETIWGEPARKDDAEDRGSGDLKEIYEAHDSVPHNHGADSGEGGHVKAVESGYKAFSFQDEGTMDEEAFKRFIRELRWEMFRVKGTVRFKDRTMLFNLVGGKSDWTAWNGSPETRLAFVGWDVDGDETIEKLKECVAS